MQIPYSQFELYPLVLLTYKRYSKIYSKVFAMAVDTCIRQKGRNL